MSADPQVTARPPSRPTVRGDTIRLGLLLTSIVGLGYVGGWSVLVVIALFVVMIGLHELGHFLAARWSGMKVTEFFIGFGPRIWSFRRGEVEYGLKAIPAGAYVKIVGMHNLEEVDPSDENRTYRQKSFPRRLAVAVAGSTMHFLIAIVLIFTLLVGFGAPGGKVFPSDRDWRVGFVSEGSAAEAIGIEPGDDIVSIAGTSVETFSDVGDLVAPIPGERVEVAFARDGELFTEVASIGATSQGAGGGVRGLLGVTNGLQDDRRLSPIAAVPRTAADFGRVSWESVKALGQLFTPSGFGSFVGQVRDANGDSTVPVEDTSRDPAAAAPEDSRLISIYGAARIGVTAIERGTAELLFFFVLINVFIGLFNLVPLLPFDGGHVAIAVYERIREQFSGDNRRHFVDVARLLPLTYAVIFVLVGIGVSSLYLDIVRPLELP